MGGSFAVAGRCIFCDLPLYDSLFWMSVGT